MHPKVPASERLNASLWHWNDEMKIRIKQREQEITAELRDFVERRLLFALSRFAPKMKRITVALSSERGPRGVEMTTCRIEIKLPHSSQVAVSVVEADLETAVAQAAERAERSVARAIERHQAAARPITYSIR